MRRKISLFILIAFVATLTIINFGCSGSPADPEGGPENPNFDINDQNIKQKLGEDDGYAFAIHYGADTHGSLETCG